MKHFLLIFAMMLMGVATVMAQRTISGTITDDTGAALPFANVYVEGTTIGTTTDIDGNYTLKVPEGGTTLIASFTGFADQKLTLGDSNTMSFTMSEGVVLDDIVVTALGIKREKKSLGYATQELGGDETTKVKDANFMNSLSGKVAGMQVKSSGTMGGSTNVIVRGYTSLSGNNQALFVVDGTPISNDNTNTGDQRIGRGGYDYGNAAMDINPEDIESINVLKGAAATALYGSRAANGAIIITTKRGVTGRKGIGVTASVGYTGGIIDKETMPKYQKLYGAGYGDFFYGAGGFDYDDLDGDGVDDLSAVVYEDASYGPAFDPSLQVYDWRSYFPELSTYGQTFPWVAAENDASNSFYEMSNTLNTSVAIDGANDKGNYRLSFTNFNQKGIVPNSKLNRNTVSFSSGYNFTDKLNVSSTINYIITDGRGRYGTGYDSRNSNQSFRQWYQTNTDMVEQREAYEETGLNISWNPYASSRTEANPATKPHYFDNPYFNVYENVPTDDRNRVFGNLSLQYDLTDWLNVVGRVSTDRYSELQEERIAIGSVNVPNYTRYTKTFSEDNYDMFLNLNKYFGSDDNISFDATLGTNIRRTTLDAARVSSNAGLIFPNIYSLGNTSANIGASNINEDYERVGVNGYFGRATFGYNQFLYLDLTGRYDFSSTLPTGKNGYFYPSASLSLVFSELFDSKFFDFGKLRLNYAQVGNDAPPLSIEDVYVIGDPFGGTPLVSVPSQKNNPELISERTKSLEAGLELKFFRDRVGLDLSVYRTNTFNQILPATVTGATGYNTLFVNAGNIQNQGIEVGLNFTPVKIGDFSWDMGINWARNDNKVIELFGDQKNLQLASVQGGITINAPKGESYGSIWGSNYVYADDGSKVVVPHPRSWGEGVVYAGTSDPEIIGNYNPDWKGGVNNRLSYQNISLSFLIDIQKGGDFFSLDTWYGYGTGIYDITAAVNDNGANVRDAIADGGGLPVEGTVIQVDTDTEGNPVYQNNDEPLYMGAYLNALGWASAPNAMHIYDASFVKLREVSLSFGLPNRVVEKTPFNALDLSFFGRNLWIIHKNSPYTDPEAGLSAGNIQGYQSGAYPAVKEFGVNLRAKF